MNDEAKKSPRRILAADYLLPIAVEPITDGAILIDGTTIKAVSTKREIVDQFPDVPIEDCGEAVIMPGLINCHSHLEITAMRGFLDDVEADFYTWLMKLTKTRAEKLSEDDVKIAARAGALEGVRAGVTCFGDIGRFGAAGYEALKANGLRGIIFQETDFCPNNETAAADFEKLEEKFIALRETETTLVRVGLSPHSPYTVSRTLFEKITDFAIAENIKISVHAAESNDETDFFQNGTGLFADLYRRTNVEWHAPRVSPIRYLSDIGVLRAQPLLAHCVKVSDADIELIAGSASRIAHCPKSNAKFGHGSAPLEKFLNHRINIGFGSDSVASNNTCDVLEEARFATLVARSRENCERFLSARQIIETATLGGAAALGLEAEIGTLEPGKQADLIVVALDNLAQLPVHDIYSTLLFASNGRDVKMTMVAGEEIYRDGAARKIDEAEIKIRMKEIAGKMSAA